MNHLRALLSGLIRLLEVDIPIRTDSDPDLDDNPIAWEVDSSEVPGYLLYMRSTFQNPHTYCVELVCSVPRINFYVPIPCLPLHHVSLTVFGYVNHTSVIDVDLGTLEDVVTGTRLITSPYSTHSNSHWFPRQETSSNEHLS